MARRGRSRAGVVDGEIERPGRMAGSGRVGQGCFDSCRRPSPGLMIGRMASLWQEFVDTVDAQISVNDGLFYSDLRAMIAWPMLPFVIVIALSDPPSTLTDVALVLLLVLEVWWVRFLFRRRREKKERWIEPTRFSDDSNGY